MYFYENKEEISQKTQKHKKKDYFKDELRKGKKSSVFRGSTLSPSKSPLSSKQNNPNFLENIQTLPDLPVKHFTKIKAPIPLEKQLPR